MRAGNKAGYIGGKCAFIGPVTPAVDVTSSLPAAIYLDSKATAITFTTDRDRVGRVRGGSTTAAAQRT